jgi:hypothetical protein
MNEPSHSHCQPLLVLPQPLVDMLDLEIMNLLRISVESDLDEHGHVDNQFHNTGKVVLVNT